MSKMKEGWEYKKLGDYIKEYSDRDKGRGFPVYSVTNTRGFCQEFFGKNVASEDTTNYKVVPRGCFAYNPSRINVGSVAWQDQEDNVSVSPLYVVFSVSPELRQDYLLYYIKSNYAMTYINALARGAVRNNLRLSTLKEFDIPFGPLDEQKQIVSELDLLSGVMEKQKAQLEELDRLAQSIFYDMFGDPVTNEKGWEVKIIKDICKVITGNTPSRNNLKYYNEDYIEWIKTDNIERDSLYPSVAKEYLSEEGAKQGRTADVGSILIACIAGSLVSIGKCCLLNRKVSFNQQINALVPKEEMNSLFVYSLVNAIAGYIRENTTNGMKHIITKSVLEEIRICVPPLSLQQEFATKVEAIEAMKAKVRLSLKEAETLFNERMDYYFN